jgi:tetratricopeptide (TPR) repeat protein
VKYVGAQELLLDGAALMERGEYRAALPLLTRAVELDPTSLAAWTWRARCLLKLGDFAEAARSFEEALTPASR